MAELPKPVTATEEYLKAAVDRLGELVTLLTPRQDDAPAEGEAVELVEPADKPAPVKKAAPKRGSRRT